MHQTSRSGRARLRRQVNEADLLFASSSQLPTYFVFVFVFVLVFVFVIVRVIVCIFDLLLAASPQLPNELFCLHRKSGEDEPAHWIPTCESTDNFTPRF